VKSVLAFEAEVALEPPKIESIKRPDEAMPGRSGDRAAHVLGELIELRPPLWRSNCDDKPTGREFGLKPTRPGLEVELTRLPE
jgi:hypothetical protein